MANDQDDERGQKDNTAKEHKPKDQARYDHAPTGSLGQERISAPAPGLGTAGRSSFQTQEIDGSAQDQKIQFRKSEDQTPGQDTRPIAVDTDDPEVNQQTDDRGDRRMSMEDIKREAGTDHQAGADKASAAQEATREENRGTFAPITGVPEIDQQSRDDGYTMIEQDDYDRMKADKLKEQQEQRRDKDKDQGL